MLGQVLRPTARMQIRRGAQYFKLVAFNVARDYYDFRLHQDLTVNVLLFVRIEHIKAALMHHHLTAHSHTVTASKNSRPFPFSWLLSIEDLSDVVSVVA